LKIAPFGFAQGKDCRLKVKTNRLYAPLGKMQNNATIFKKKISLRNLQIEVKKMRHPFVIIFRFLLTSDS